MAINTITHSQNLYWNGLPQIRILDSARLSDGLARYKGQVAMQLPGYSLSTSRGRKEDHKSVRVQTADGTVLLLMSGEYEQV